MYNSEELRRYGSFRVSRGELLFIRFGPANAQRQLHNRRPISPITLKPIEWEEDRGPYAAYPRRTPVNRGIWAFPYPLHDAFFYWHTFERHLPKRLQRDAIKAASDDESLSEDEMQRLWDEEHDAIKRIRRRERPRMIWWAGPIYSHLAPPGQGERSWYLWPSVTDWADEARKHLWTYHRWGNNVSKMRYARDHLECFLPKTAALAKHNRSRRGERAQWDLDEPEWWDDEGAAYCGDDFPVDLGGQFGRQKVQEVLHGLSGLRPK